MPAAAAGFHDMEAPFGQGFTLAAGRRAGSDRALDSDDSSAFSRLTPESSHDRLSGEGMGKKARVWSLWRTSFQPGPYAGPVGLAAAFLECNFSHFYV